MVVTLIPMSVVETPGFIRDAAAAMSDTEHVELISFLALNPDSGEIMARTGGCRKLR
jgi:hypothetical protein